MGHDSDLEDYKKVINDSSKWPTEEDLKQEIVFLDDELIKKTEDVLHKSNRCLIKGAEGRGKTVLTRIVAYIRHNEKWEIWFLDISQIKEENIHYVYKQIEFASRNEKTLFIFENSHASIDKITKPLVEFTTKECQKSSFIFTSRKISHPNDDFLNENPFEEWEENGWYVDITPTSKTVRSIIEKFISVNNINYSLTSQDELWIGNEIGIKDDQSGTANLRRLKWYLDAWKEKGGNLYEVEKNEVLRNTEKHILRKYNSDPDTQDMLLQVSGVFQFDVNFYGDNYDKSILTKLTETGIVTSLSGYYYKLQHSIDAKYIIEAEARCKAKKDADVLTTRILEKYLRSKPENYNKILRALYDSGEKDILFKILNNPENCEAVFDMVVNGGYDGTIADYMLQLKLIFSDEKALEVWRDYKKRLGQTPEEQKKELRLKLNKMNIHGIRSLLTFLKKVDVDERNWLVMEVLDEDMLIEKMNETSFSAIQKTIEVLPKEKLPTIVPKLDPEILAYKATKMETKSAQSIMWVLRYSLMGSRDKKFSYLFLLALHKEGTLIDLLKTSNFKIVDGFLNETKKVNLDLYNEIKSSLSPYWLDILLSSKLAQIEEQLGHLCHKKHRWHFARPENSAQLIIKNLASTDLSEPIRELYTRSEKPVVKLGRLLDHIIKIKTDDDNLEIIAWQIVNNIELTNKEKYTIKELADLLINVRKCSRTAGTQLCEKISSDLNLFEYIEIPVAKGLVFLVLQLYQYDKEIGQELADRIFSLDINKMYDSSKPKSMKQTILDMREINWFKTERWKNNLDKKKLESLDLDF